MGLIAAAAAAAGPLALGCIVEPEPIEGVQTFRVRITAVNGGDPPTAAAPLPANNGSRNDTVDIDVRAADGNGNPIDFNGFVRVSIEPGAIVELIDPTGKSRGRNLAVQNGRATAQLVLTATYGPTRLVVEDIGYVPARPGRVPACANGVDDDGDKLVDFPTDPGCAFADDDDESTGSYAAGTSAPLQFALPTIRDLQGARETPFPYEGLEIKTDDPNNLIVTSIVRNGFFVTDLADQALGYNHLFVFSFATPPGLRVCDRIVQLSGTVIEFFGFTELTFPSYRGQPVFEGQPCLVPVPALLDSADPELDPRPIDSRPALEGQESGLVRVRDYLFPVKFGAKPALDNLFESDRSNCDLNGDGTVDFQNNAEASCSNACNLDPECSEWTQYSARGNYKIFRGNRVIQVNSDGAPELDPVENRGALFNSVTGALRNFAGGSLNWTIEVRCPDDVVCDARGCVAEEKPPSEACVRLRPIEDDNDEER